MSKKNVSRVSKYAAYRRQIAKMPDITQTAISKVDKATGIKEEIIKPRVNTTTSLNADTILEEIEKRTDPTGKNKKEQEKLIRRQRLIEIVSYILVAAIIIAVLTIVVVFLYRRLS